MNVHGAGIVRRSLLLEPKRIREPGLGPGGYNQVARPKVVQADVAAMLPFVNRGNAVVLIQDLPYARQIARVADVDMGDLMVTNRKRPTGERVELAAERSNTRRRPCRARSRFT